MADQLTAAEVSDPQIREELQRALANGRLSVAEVRRIINAATSDRARGARSSIDQTEYQDLLTVLQRSTTLSNRSRGLIRQAILVNYLRFALRDRQLGATLQRMLRDSRLTLQELNQVVQTALSDNSLSANEVRDLLDLRRVVTAEQRVFLLIVLQSHVQGNAPPRTQAATVNVGPRRGDPLGQYRFAITTQADSHNVRGVSGGRTVYNLNVQRPRVRRAGRGQVEITQWPRVTGITVQTRYGRNAAPNDNSAYGRGTTDADILSGDLSLGFHEHCHREAVGGFVRTNAIPEFGGTSARMRVREYNRLLAAFRRDIRRFSRRLGRDDGAQVDEVGYTLAEHRRQGRLRRRTRNRMTRMGWAF